MEYRLSTSKWTILAHFQARENNLIYLDTTVGSIFGIFHFCHIRGVSWIRRKKPLEFSGSGRIFFLYWTKTVFFSKIKNDKVFRFSWNWIRTFQMFDVNKLPKSSKMKKNSPWSYYQIFVNFCNNTRCHIFDTSL